MTRNVHSDHRHPERWNLVTIPARVAERAHNRYLLDGDGCWVSQYSTASHGYAQIGWTDADKRHMVLAHRASWVHVNGQIPVGLTLDHLCKNRRCVNPTHLRLLSNYENARRNNGSNWPIWTCAKGHPSPALREVSRRAKSGRKYTGLECKACAAESRTKWLKNNPAKRKLAVQRSNAKRKLKGRTDVPDIT